MAQTTDRGVSRARAGPALMPRLSSLAARGVRPQLLNGGSLVLCLFVGNHRGQTRHHTLNSGCHDRRRKGVMLVLPLCGRLAKKASRPDGGQTPRAATGGNSRYPTRGLLVLAGSRYRRSLFRFGRARGAADRRAIRGPVTKEAAGSATAGASDSADGGIIRHACSLRRSRRDGDQQFERNFR